MAKFSEMWRWPNHPDGCDFWPDQRLSHPLLEEEELYQKLRYRCPDCGGTGGFWLWNFDARGRTLACVNRECRAGFVITPTRGHAVRYSNAEPWRYPSEETV